MYPRVERLPQPAPDYQRFLDVVARKRPPAVPLLELAIAREVIAALLDEPVAPPENVLEQSIRAHNRLGYDVVKVSAVNPFLTPRLRSATSDTEREWQDQHTGVIQSMEDADACQWPTAEEVDCSPLKTAAGLLPAGMKLIGFSGGVLEFAMDLLGMERMMFALYDAPDLVAVVFERVGRTIHHIFENYCRIDAVCAIWLGDDLGSKNGLLISPDALRQHVFPWFRRYAELAHAHGKPFLLHSCGGMYGVMDDLLDAGIDAKHSFEDGVLPVERFVDQWGTRVATLGGVDVSLLAQGPEEAIVERTERILSHVADRGGYACGSGNSIPSYVPTEHFLAMVETVHRFNGGL